MGTTTAGRSQRSLSAATATTSLCPTALARSSPRAWWPRRLPTCRHATSSSRYPRSEAFYLPPLLPAPLASQIKLNRDIPQSSAFTEQFLESIHGQYPAFTLLLQSCARAENNDLDSL